MGAVTVITDADAAVGFRLAGVKAIAAADPAEAERHLRDCIASGDAAVVLVSQGLLEGVGDVLRRRIERAGIPIVVPIPISPAWWGEERAGDYVVELIRRAIGFQMRIGRAG